MSSGVMTDLLAYWPFVRDVPSNQSTAAVGSLASALDDSLRTAARGAAPRLVDGVTLAAGGVSGWTGRGVATSLVARSVTLGSLLAFGASVRGGVGALPVGGTRPASGAGIDLAGATVVSGDGVDRGGVDLAGATAVGDAGADLAGVTGASDVDAPRLLDDARRTAVKPSTLPATSTSTVRAMTTSRRCRRDRCRARTCARRSKRRSSVLSLWSESVALGPGPVANLLPHLARRVCPGTPGG
jgi:hypothetical protein